MDSQVPEQAGSGRVSRLADRLLRSAQPIARWALIPVSALTLYVAFELAAPAGSQAAHGKLYVAFASTIFSVLTNIIPVQLVVAFIDPIVAALGAARHDEDKQTEGAQLAQRLSEVVNTRLDEIKIVTESNTAHLNLYMDSVISGWSQVVHDTGMRDELKRLTDKVGSSPLARNEEHRVVLRSLVRGMVTRLARLVDSIENVGSVMDPQERRKLTEELVAATRSYHVITVGLHYPLTGPWRWHEEYLGFLREAAARPGYNVSWTIVAPSSASPVDIARIAEELRTLNVSCYAFDLSDRGYLTSIEVGSFQELGCFIEVFGAGFLPGQNRGVPPALTWKATALRKRAAGGGLDPFDVGRDGAMLSNEGVWSSDEVLKLVRIGVVGNEPSAGPSVLSRIGGRRKPCTPDGPPP